MNPSRLFILRPVATSLLMAAIAARRRRRLPAAAGLGAAAGRLPDDPGRDVLSGREPGRDGLAVTAPLERQFGQMPGLEPDDVDQLRRRLGHHAAVRPRARTSTSPSRKCRRRSTRPARFLPTRPADPADLQQGQPGRRADPDAGARPRRRCRCRRCEDLADTRLAQKISQLPGVGLVSISGGQKPAVRIQANPTALAAYGLDARGRAHGDRGGQRQPGQGQLRRPAAGVHDRRQRSAAVERRLPAARSSPTATARRSACRTSPTSSTASRTCSQAAWMNDDAGRHPQRPAPAGRQHHRRSSTASRRCCRSCTASLPAVGRRRRPHRPHDHHPRLGARRAVRADADDRARRAGDLPVPAQRCRRRSSRASPCRCRSSARSA